MAEKKECRKCGDELVLDETPKIVVKGREVGIADLEDIIKEVEALSLNDEKSISQALLHRVKERDFVPSSVEREYEMALLEEYRRRF